MAFVSALPLKATSANKAALEQHYDRFLTRDLARCTTCHLPSEKTAPESLAEFPHNPFGHRLRLLGQELAKNGAKYDLPSRLITVAKEDSDRDGVDNETELLLGHNPGNDKNTPNSKALQDAPPRRAEFMRFLASYRWQPFEPVKRPPVPLVSNLHSAHPGPTALDLTVERVGRRVPSEPNQKHELNDLTARQDGLALPPKSPASMAAERQSEGKLGVQGATIGSHTKHQASSQSQIPNNPIDAFIAAEHQARNLRPRPEASKEVLHRRVYLDLIGLTPTPEEQRAFASDTSADAYEKLVDRLLNDPRYGERWGRHWMDIWRYSDWAGWSGGNQIRDSKPHIWRWRDWIVESLNEDKGYDRMVEEMLAADELAPEDTNALRATGFLVRNYKMLSREQWLEDTIKHTSQAFLGLTVGCAKCHDHMFDPISQSEYYQIRAVFEPHQVRTDRVPGQTDRGCYELFCN